MDGECTKMDLTTRARDVGSQEIGCKMRMAKSVFSIRSLVDLGENAHALDEKSNPLFINGK